MIKNRRGDGAGPPYPDADDSPNPERPGSKYITPLSLSLWPHPIQKRDPASREGWQYEEGQKYLYLGLQYKEQVENNVKIAKKSIKSIKYKSIKSHDQQTFHEGNRYVLHMKYIWAWTWTKVWGHEMFHDDKSQM